MKTAILGAGAMGSVMGAALARAGNDVVLIDVADDVIEAIRSRGLILQDKAGQQENVRIPVTDQPGTVGPVDLIMVFVKCYHTESAIRSAKPLIGPATTILSLQNGK